MRKVIQIAEVSAEIFALCNDGSIWFLSRGTDKNWQQLINVPQPDPLPIPGYRSSNTFKQMITTCSNIFDDNK